MSNIATLSTESVCKAYARWAPIYDLCFGAIAQPGRTEAVKVVNQRQGRVLELGVGTGISLPQFADHLRITAIDISPEMLAKARKRLAERRLTNIEGVYEMDAAYLKFEDSVFETVVAMYVMTVAPNPARVLRELERVCAPGGEVIIVNHFSQEKGLRAWVEKVFAPLAGALGWRPQFPIEQIVSRTEMRLLERRPLAPWGLFTLLRFRKSEEPVILLPQDQCRDYAREEVSHN